MEFMHQFNEYFSALGPLGLCLNSFIESFFLVPPPDFLLIAMDLKEPNKALYFAFICTIASALGGAVGYGIGKWFGRPAFDWIFSGLQKKETIKQKNILIELKFYIINMEAGLYFLQRLPRFHIKSLQ